MKFLLNVFVLTGLLAVAFAYTTMGEKTPTSVLAFAQYVDFGNYPDHYESITINFPPKGQVNNKLISYIKIEDFTEPFSVKKRWSGGPGFTYASINLRTVLSRGFNAKVEIWIENSKIPV